MPASVLSEPLSRLFLLIANDMKQPISYLPPVFLVGAVLFLSLLLSRRFTKLPIQRILFLTLCAIYFAVTMQTAFFSREPGSRTGIDLIPFSTWGKSQQAHAYVIENIIMFIPFGLLFPTAFPQLRRAPACVLLGFCFSTLIELMQLFTQRGHCQVDDVITNTFGALLGWTLFCFVRFCAKRLRENA